MLLILACTAPEFRPPDSTPPSDTAGDGPHAAERPVVPLADAALFRRASLDVRGTLPTIAELAALEPDPGALEGRLDALLVDPAHEERLVDMFAERWNMRVDEVSLSSQRFDVDPLDEYGYLRSVEEEPLRLMARIGRSELPWTDIVTADWTMADEMLGSLWPVAREAGDGWQVATYTDGRPANGVLATNGMWWRYATTPNNYNRTRAAAISRLLLCEDYLERPIRFEPANLLARDDLLDATRHEPTCVGCHSTLDPLAAALFGFWNNDLFLIEEHVTYHPDREFLGAYYLGVEPAWYGAPLTAAADLGPMVAADDRFVACTVETLAEALWRRDVDPVADFGVLQDLRTQFTEGELRLGPLIRAVLDTADYRAGTLTSDATDADAESVQTRRLVPVQALSSAVADLTGFTWDREGWDQLDNDNHGFRTLAGDVDGESLTRPTSDPTVSRALVMKRVAQSAAAAAVDADFATDGERRLFGEVDTTDVPGSAPFDAQLLALHLRLYASVPDADRLASDAALFSAAHAASGDTRAAWKTLLAGMLRDPAFWTY